MSAATMPEKKRPRAGVEPGAGPNEGKAGGRKTAPVQVEKELAHMLSVISAHRGESISDLVSPLVRQWVRTNYALVQQEMAANVQRMREEDRQ